MSLGRRDEPSVRYPDLGAVIARELGQADAAVPDYVSFYAQTEGRGATKLDGKMIDQVHLSAAKKVLEQAHKPNAA